MLFAEWGGNTYISVILACEADSGRLLQASVQPQLFMRLSENKMFDYLLYPVVWSIWFTVSGLVQWVQTQIRSHDSWDTHLR